MEKNRIEKLELHETKLLSIIQMVEDETANTIANLKLNKNILIERVKRVVYEIRVSLNPNKENMLQTMHTRVSIEKNELNKNELKELNKIIIPDLKKQLNELSVKYKSYENHYEFKLNKIPESVFEIGQLETV